MDQVIVLPVLGGCPNWNSLCGLWNSVLYSHYWAGRQADSHVLRQPGRADICVHAQLERGDNSRNFIVLVWQFVCYCVRMYYKFIDCQTVWTGWYSYMSKKSNCLLSENHYKNFQIKQTVGKKSQELVMFQWIHIVSWRDCNYDEWINMGKSLWYQILYYYLKKTSKILTYKSLLSIVQRNIRIRNHSSHSYLWVLIYHAPSVFILMQSLETTDKLLFI